MSSTDDRIVKMRFDNAQFKKGAAETKKSLDDVNKAVDSAGKNKGLLDLSGTMGSVRVKASAMQVSVATAIANITNRAVNAGISMAKSLSFDPIMDGFREYELKMKSIQTILANTEGENLKSVSASLKELNEYSDKTIYNFANMTENIGKLTTAGIKLDDATATVKGFSNMVALAGGDAQAAAGAMEQFGQGLQAGVIKAIDWQSISTRGLGSQSLQKAFFETARAAGTLKDVPLSTTFKEWTKANGGFKGSLEKGWLTSDVATKALKIMTGDIKDVQQLMKMGFDKKTATDMLEIANNALDSATKVRTFSAFMGTLKEQLGSGWSEVLEILIGDFEEATDLFTALSEKSGNIIDGFFGGVRSMLKVWDDLGGRAKVLETVGNLLAPIGAIVSTIGKAWKSAFPSSGAGSGAVLYGISWALEAITSPLRLLADLISGATPVLATFFKIVKMGGKGIGEVIGFIVDLVSNLEILGEIDAPSAGGFLDWVKKLGASIKTAVDEVDELMSKGASLASAFGSVDIKLPSMPKMPSMSGIKGLFGSGSKEATSGLAATAAPVKNLTDNIVKLNDASKDTVSSGVFNAKAKLDTSQVETVGSTIKALATDVKSSGEDVETVGDKIGPILTKMKNSIGEFLSGFSFEDLVSSFNLAVLSTFVISLSRFFNTMTKSFQGFAGVGESITGVLDNAGDALKSFQTQARAKLILNIAIALGILAVSLWILSRIPADKMVTALAGLGGVVTGLVLTMKQMTKVIDSLDGKGANVKLIALSIAFIALGSAMVLLAVAAKIMDSVGWDGVLKNIVTMAVLMNSFKMLGDLAEKSYKNIVGAAVAIGIIAGSMLVLAAALLLFKLVDWGSMGKAGVALGGIALAVGLLALIPYEGIAKVGLALLGASVGMLAIANAFLIFGAVNWSSIIKGIVVLGMLALTLAVLMAVGNPMTISGIVSLGVAMIALAMALLVLNKVDWSSIGKLAVILLALVVALAALLAVLYLAAPIIPILGLFALALIALGVAFGLFAAGLALAMTLAAAGTAAFVALATGAAVAIAVFMQTLAAEAPIIKDSVLKILQAIIDTIVGAVPMVIDGIKRLWNAIIQEFKGEDKKKEVGDAGKGWVESLRDKIKENMPIIVQAAKDLVIKFVRGLTENAEKIGSEAAKFVAKFINGIADNLGGVIQAGANLIIAWIKGITTQSARIAVAAADAVITFINEMADAIRNKGPQLGEAMGNLGVAMVEGLIGGIGSMFTSAMGKIGELAEGMVSKAKGILKIFSPSRVFMSIGMFLVQGLTNGIQNNAAAAITAVASMVSGQIAVANEYISKFIQKLDQQAIAARAKADGLAAAAARAEKYASKTKSKADDKAAARLGKRAEKAAKQAEESEAKAEREKAKQDRQEKFKNASLLEKAQMRSEDAQSQLDAAKAAEGRAAKALVQADALDRQSKAKGVTAKQRKAMQKEADRLRAQAKKDANTANDQLAAAKKSAADALAYQKKAGDEAAAAFEAAYKAEAKTAADDAAFEKLSDAEKAEQRKKQAAELQKQADANLAKAKKLAYTDLEAANDLAQQALDEAERARQYLADAAQYESSASQGISSSVSGGVTGTVVNVEPTAAAALAFNEYADLYKSATAAAAGARVVEFNQYNTSPEALSPTEVYRHTNNQLAFAADKLADAAA